MTAANPLATQAGQEMLQLGGGAFLLHFDGRRTQAFDGRETAPAGATPRLFLGRGRGYFGGADPRREGVVLGD